MGATAVMTGVMLLTKTVVDATIPRPPPKQSGPAKPKKKKSGSLRESLQVSTERSFQSSFPCHFRHSGASRAFAWHCRLVWHCRAAENLESILPTRAADP